jgi:hypothetical protein
MHHVFNFSSQNSQSRSNRNQRAFAAILAATLASMTLFTMSFEINPGQHDRTRHLEIIALSPVRPHPERQPPNPKPKNAPTAGMAVDAPPTSPAASDAITPPKNGILLWSRSDIAPTVSPNITTVPAGRQGGEGPGSITGNDGIGAYDPYAGAAPMRRDSNLIPLNPGDTLPRYFGADLNSGLAARLAGYHGRAFCQINFDQAGSVISANCEQIIGNAPKRLIQHSLIGIAIDRTHADNSSASGWVIF